MENSEKVQRDTYLTQDLELVKYLFANDEYDSLVRCGRDKHAENVTYYVLKQSQKAKNLYHKYVSETGNRKVTTVRDAIWSTFIVDSPDVAKAIILDYGCIGELLAYREDKKAVGNMIYMFNKNGAAHKAYMEIIGKKEKLRLESVNSGK